MAGLWPRGWVDYYRSRALRSLLLRAAVARVGLILVGLGLLAAGALQAHAALGDISARGVPELIRDSANGWR
jgi:hypothetical protein